MPSHREPIFNVPGVVVALIASFVAVQLVRDFFLVDDNQTEELIQLFAFIPARYDDSLLLPPLGGYGAGIWTFVTYAFIHGGWTHLIVNSIWFLPFGSAVARRFGTARFLAFFAVTAAAGALAHLVTHVGERSAMIGASAAISGTMAGAMRFAFQRGGPLGFWREQSEAAYRVPALPLSGVLRDPRVVIFLVVWLGINVLFGATTLSFGTGNEPVAWQAHIGGFVAGLLLFSLFDPPARSAGGGGSSDPSVAPHD